MGAADINRPASCLMTIAEVMEEVAAERRAQEAKMGDPRTWHFVPEAWLAHLGMIAGDVCVATLAKQDGLHRSLVRLAATCAAWAFADEPMINFDAWHRLALRSVRPAGLCELPWLMRGLGEIGEVIAVTGRVARPLLARLAGIAMAWACLVPAE